MDEHAKRLQWFHETVHFFPEKYGSLHVDNGNFGASAISENMFGWIPREFNSEADELANVGCLVGNRIVQAVPVRKCSRFFRVHFDGSAQDGKIGGGWVLEQAWCIKDFLGGNHV